MGEARSPPPASVRRGPRGTLVRGAVACGFGQPGDAQMVLVGLLQEADPRGWMQIGACRRPGQGGLQSSVWEGLGGELPVQLCLPGPRPDQQQPRGSVQAPQLGPEPAEGAGPTSTTGGPRSGSRSPRSLPGGEGS